MFQKILVPLDGSELAERALEPAFALAKAAGGELLMLSIPYLKHLFLAETAGYGLLWPEQSLAYTRDELAAYLQTLAERHAQPGLNLHSRVVEGDEASVIVDTAVSEKIDLIVMSTHGRSGLSHWYLGSVTEKVLQSAPCPVLVMRDAVRSFGHTLITLDGSHLSEQALTPALAVADCFDTAVTLLRVEQPEDLDPNFIYELDAYESGLGSQAREAINFRTENYLSQIAERHQPRCQQKIQLLVMSGSAAKEILTAIEAGSVDLVVMATHGRTGLRRWVYGSVTEKVMRQANCAVLIVRPPALP